MWRVTPTMRSGRKFLKERDDEACGVEALALHDAEDGGDDEAGEELEGEFLAGGEAEVSLVDDLDVVVRKADGTEGDGGAHDDPDERIAEV